MDIFDTIVDSKQDIFDQISVTPIPAAMLKPGPSIVGPQREPDVQPVGEMLPPTPNDVPLLNISPESLKLAFPPLGLARAGASLIGPTAENIERGLEKG